MGQDNPTSRAIPPSCGKAGFRALLFCLLPLLTWACAAPATAPGADIESTARATASPAATAFASVATPERTVAPTRMAVPTATRTASPTSAPKATRTADPTSTPASTSAPTATAAASPTQTAWPLVPPGAHVTGAEDAPVAMVAFFNFT